MVGNNVLIYDCETLTFSGRPDPSKDRLRIFGCYSYKTKKMYLLKDKEEIQKTIDAHKFLVGFYNKGYDNPILEREGINLKYKIIIDLKQIFKTRASQMKIEKGMLGDLLMRYSLDYITKTLGIVDEESGKQKIDYSIFQRKLWTPEETATVIEYTKRDIDVTRKLYEYVEDYFSVFKSFLNEADINKKVYLTCTTAVFAYKVLCKELNMEEEYDNEKREERFGGGYVAYPAGENFDEKDGEILYLDYSSLYPNIFIQANLFGSNCDCCEIHEKWNGDGFFKVEGFYCKKKQSKITTVFKKLYEMRQDMKKKKDPKEYSLKIVLNSTYGAVSNPAFKNIHNLIAAKDCTNLGRQIIKYTRKRFREEGFKNIMADTDSTVIQIPKNKTKEDAIILSKKIVEEIQEHLSFPW